jgi:hypothetical protein
MTRLKGKTYKHSSLFWREHHRRMQNINDSSIIQRRTCATVWAWRRRCIGRRRDSHLDGRSWPAQNSLWQPLTLPLIIFLWNLHCHKILGAKAIKHFFSSLLTLLRKARVFGTGRVFQAGLMFVIKARSSILKWSRVKCSTWVSSDFTRNH